MMKYSPLLTPIADELYKLLECYEPITVKDYGWENYVWTSDSFKWAHLEKFYTEKVSVLHCVVMPLPNSYAPIYGFDVIEINGRLTGMFMDLTPVSHKPFPLHVPKITGEDRAIPQWADFFSNDFRCCIPQPTDLHTGVDLFSNYLKELPNTVTNDEDYTVAHQNYVEGQKRNPQTYRMLKSHIGQQLATEFIDNVLWPNIINN